MKNLFLLILPVFLLIGCNKKSTDTKSITNDHVFDRTFKIEDMVIEIPDSIQIEEWATDGNEILLNTGNPYCMFISISLDSIKISNSFGKKGKGPGEFIMPHVLGHENNGFLIIDNGNKKILRVTGNNLSDPKEDDDMGVVNLPIFISDEIIGYQELSPNKLNLIRYNISNGEKSTIISFPERGETDNSDLYDFVWDTNNNMLVTGHFYADRFSIRKIDNDGKQEHILHINGDDKFRQDRIVYSDIKCGDYIYLLCQNHVNIDTFSGNSVIEKYDYEGNPITQYVFDGIIDKIILDKKKSRMFFTSTEDENIHYFNL